MLVVSFRSSSPLLIRTTFYLTPRLDVHLRSWVTVSSAAPMPVLLVVVMETEHHVSDCACANATMKVWREFRKERAAPPASTIYTRILKSFLSRMEISMKDVTLPGPHTRIVMFADTVFKLKFKLRYICIQSLLVWSLSRGPLAVLINLSLGPLLAILINPVGSMLLNNLSTGVLSEEIKFSSGVLLI